MPGNIDQLLLVYDDIQDADDAAAVNKDEMDSNLSLTRSKSNQSLSVHQYLHHPSHQMEHKHTILRSVSQTDLIAPALRTNTPPVNVQATANGTVFNGTRSNPSSGSSSSALPTPTGRKHAGSNMSSGGYNRGSVPGPTVLTSGQKDKRYHFGSYQKQHSQTSINLRKPVVTTEHPPHPARPASPNLRQRGGMSPSPSTSRLSQFEAMEGELEDLDLGDTAHRSDVPATITIAPHHTVQDHRCTLLKCNQHHPNTQHGKSTQDIPTLKTSRRHINHSHPAPIPASEKVQHSLTFKYTRPSDK
ncbi:hypothetical protein SARC_02860 [Sphaeroforma arctica JP610]|uniref:Uncharacterized protein n=1 Tax=Sphaeroforma arctica JP610 TaxID=667725 RepID=A0A0L0G9J7_9EUKA|nr:hypothetical protein SARC_02860 [Sphaeroforma arctica JP610]KNC84938.1 hypothetical protein SARC_02860 [Sphaeroforma arctica JP610]|eukprot:XP_014158840.1 hypothetical protein SARC_02860 [Sphaeroforma arctica JP610]